MYHVGFNLDTLAFFEAPNMDAMFIFAVSMGTNFCCLCGGCRLPTLVLEQADSARRIADRLDMALTILSCFPLSKFYPNCIDLRFDHYCFE